MIKRIRTYKQQWSILLTVLFFVANIGIGVHSLWCLCEKTFYYSLQDIEHFCQKHELETVKQTTCCAKKTVCEKQTNKTELSEDCCKTEFKKLSIEDGFLETKIQKVKIDIVYLFFPIIRTERYADKSYHGAILFSISEKYLHANSIHAPPKFYNKTLLAYIKKWNC